MGKQPHVLPILATAVILAAITLLLGKILPILIAP